MIGPFARALLHVAGGAAGLAALVLAFGAWRLAHGPVSLTFLAPHIERALIPPELGVRLSFDDLSFGLGGGGYSLGIRASGVRARHDDGRIDLRVPAMTVAPSVPALARGVVAPGRLDLYAPVLHVRRARAPANEETSAGRADSLRQAMSGVRGLLAGARELNLVDATVVVHEGGSARTWFSPFARLSAEPRSGGIAASAAAAVESGGETLEFEATAFYNSDRGTAAVRAAFENLVPAGWARLAPAAAPAAALDLPLTGEIAFAADPAGRIDSIAFDLSGGAGTVAPPPPYAPGASLAVTGVRAAGRLEDGLRRLAFDELSLDFGGPGMTLEGSVESGTDRPDITLEIAARGVPVDEFAVYWPGAAAPLARRWVLENMSGGTLEALDMRIDVSGADWELAHLPADRVSGQFDVAGTAIRYSEDLPPAHGVRASGRFDAAVTTVDVHSGRTGPLDIRDAEVEIRAGPDSAGFVRVEGSFAGDVGETLAALDRPPFDVAGALPLDPARISGAVVGELTLRVPLDASAGDDRIDVSVAADIRGAAVEFGTAGGRRLHDGTATLSLEKDGFELVGEASIDGVRGSVFWHEAFAPPPGVPRRRVDVTTVLDAPARDRLGMSAAWLDGPVTLRARAWQADGEAMTVDVDVDAAGAAVDLPALPWLKPPHAPAAARAALVLGTGGVAAVPSFEIAADAFSASGSAARSGGGPWTIRLDRFAAGDTDVSASVVLGETPEIAVDGGRLALPIGGTDTAEHGRVDAAAVPPFALSANVDTLLLGETLRLDGGTVRLAWNGDTLDRADIDGRLAGGAPLTLRLRQAPAPDRRAVTVATDDAGQLLRTLDLTPNMRGGRLTLDGEIDDGPPSRPIRGVLLIDDFRMVDAPVLTRLLSFVSVTGALERLGGEGLVFERFRAPYTYEDGRLTLDRALASGVSLGLTMDGTIDFRRDTVDVRGNMVPFYALNSMVGAIPLVGDLLTGGENEGVVAMPYRITGRRTEPDVAVNPLAIAAPGVLRELLVPGGRSGGR